jgi:hypothetical protein
MGLVLVPNPVIMALPHGTDLPFWNSKVAFRISRRQLDVMGNQQNGVPARIAGGARPAVSRLLRALSPLCGFGNTQKPFNNVRVRQAFAVRWINGRWPMNPEDDPPTDRICLGIGSELTVQSCRSSPDGQNSDRGQYRRARTGTHADPRQRRAITARCGFLQAQWKATSASTSHFSRWN